MSNAAADRADVVISGASFAGLALAGALAQAFEGELAIALVDRGAPGQAGEASDSRASAIAAGSKRMLDVLGVWGDVAHCAQPVRRIEISDSSLEDGVRPTLLAYDNEIAGGEPATYIVPNAPLLAALARRTLAAPGVRLIAGQARALSLETGEASVGLEDGRRIGCRLVVAADGRRSLLREAAGLKTVGWSYGQTGIVVIVAHERPHDGIAVQHFLPGGPFAILPLTGNRSCVTWSERADEAARIMALSDPDFLAELDKRFGGRLGALSLAAPRQSWPLGMHLARRYVATRFALVGDAAHGVHPIAGQGLNLALRDAAALAEVVTDAARLGLDIADAGALEKYERWRRFDSSTSATVFDGLNRLFSNDSMLLRTARAAGLGVVDRLPWLKSMLVTEAAGQSGELPRLVQGKAL
jgi:2-octaprenyl-6-methoxyphenol hydroxylase